MLPNPTDFYTEWGPDFKEEDEGRVLDPMSYERPSTKHGGDVGGSSGRYAGIDRSCQ